MLFEKRRLSYGFYWKWLPIKHSTIKPWLMECCWQVFPSLQRMSAAQQHNIWTLSEFFIRLLKQILLCHYEWLIVWKFVGKMEIVSNLKYNTIMFVKFTVVQQTTRHQHTQPHRLITVYIHMAALSLFMQKNDHASWAFARHGPNWIGVKILSKKFEPLLELA